MKSRFLPTLAITAIALSAGAALAAPGFATGNVNLRAGPSTQYPAIVVVPDGAPVNIRGCLRDGTWCDVSFEGNRGWVSNAYLQTVQRGARAPLRVWRGPVITFDVGRYWGSNYRDRPFYGEWNRWNRYNRDYGWERPGRPGPDFGGPGWRDGRPDGDRRGDRPGWRQGGPRADGPGGERPRVEVPRRGGPNASGPGTAAPIDVTPQPPASPAIPRLPQ